MGVEEQVVEVKGGLLKAKKEAMEVEEAEVKNLVVQDVEKEEEVKGTEEEI